MKNVAATSGQSFSLDEILFLETCKVETVDSRLDRAGVLGNFDGFLPGRWLHSSSTAAGVAAPGQRRGPGTTQWSESQPQNTANRLLVKKLSKFFSAMQRVQSAPETPAVTSGNRTENGNGPSAARASSRAPFLATLIVGLQTY